MAKAGQFGLGLACAAYLEMAGDGQSRARVLGEHRRYRSSIENFSSLIDVAQPGKLSRNVPQGALMAFR